MRQTFDCSEIVVAGIKDDRVSVRAIVILCAWLAARTVVVLNSRCSRLLGLEFDRRAIFKFVSANYVVQRLGDNLRRVERVDLTSNKVIALETHHGLVRVIVIVDVKRLAPWNSRLKLGVSARQCVLQRFAVARYNLLPIGV